MLVNWDDELPNFCGKIKVMFQSPPTREYISTSTMNYINCNNSWTISRIHAFLHQKTKPTTAPLRCVKTHGDFFYRIPGLADDDVVVSQFSVLNDVSLRKRAQKRVVAVCAEIWWFWRKMRLNGFELNSHILSSISLQECMYVHKYIYIYIYIYVQTSNMHAFLSVY